MKSNRLFITSMLLAALTGSSQAMADDRLLSRERFYSDDYQSLFGNVSVQDQVRQRDPSAALQNSDLAPRQGQTRLRDSSRLQSPSSAAQNQTRLRDQAYSERQSGTRGSPGGFSEDRGSTGRGSGRSRSARKHR